MQKTASVPSWNARDGSKKSAHPNPHRTSFDKYALAVQFSLHGCFYKMRLIRSSQAEFGQTNHLYTTSSRRVGQPMYISASYGVHVNSCNVHELYALGNDRMSSHSRPQSITRTKTPRLTGCPKKTHS